MGVITKVAFASRDKDNISDFLDFIWELFDDRPVGEQYKYRVMGRAGSVSCLDSGEYVFDGELWSCDIGDIEYWIMQKNRSEEFKNILFLEGVKSKCSVNVALIEGNRSYLAYSRKRHNITLEDNPLDTMYDKPLVLTYLLEHNII